MTDKRDLEDRVSDLRDRLGGGKQTIVAYRDPVTGDLEDLSGNPIDPDGHGADDLVILNVSEVMERERAEKEGREIVGEYEGGPVERDLVKIPVGRIESDDLPNGMTSK